MADLEVIAPGRALEILKWWAEQEEVFMTVHPEAGKVVFQRHRGKKRFGMTYISPRQNINSLKRHFAQGVNRYLEPRQERADN
jgi:hypothetical protein